MDTEKRLKFVYILLIAAALYNFAFATWVIADPAAVKALVGVASIKSQMVIRFMVPVLLMGCIYLVGYYVPSAAFHVLFIGLLTKIVPPVLAVLGVTLRDASPAWLGMVFFNDVIWWYPFLKALSDVSGPPTTSRINLRNIAKQAFARPTLCAAMAIAITSILGVSLSLLSVNGAGTYGKMVFLSCPFTLSLLSVLLYSIGGRRELAECIGVASVPSIMSLVLLLCIAAEGIICVIMALPLILLLNVIGGLLGYFIQRFRFSRSKTFLCSLVLVNPFVLGTECIHQPKYPIETVSTEITVNKSMQEIWKVFEKSIDLRSETEWLEELGFSVPRSAVIVESGQMNVLRCHFKHGYTDFPIEELKAGTSVRFSPHGLTPNPMEETGLFEGIEVPHLEGYFDVRFGEITLVPAPNGGTTLRATTEYVHRIGPSQYWTLWSGAIIDKLHMAVLRAIVEPAERSERAE